MHSFLIERVKAVAKAVDEYILSRVKGSPETVYEAALHLIRAGGKRLRPFIVVTVAECLGGSREDALPFAAAVELVHNFTLVHDDIMDRDEVRRGVPTVHVLWGEPMAITAGDLLFAKAFEVLAEATARLGAERVSRAAYELARATVAIAEGQAMDLLFERRDKVTLDEYLTMVSKKTGALFEVSAVLGGLAAPRVSDDVIQTLKDFGMNLGIAFQIRDDVLGIVADEKTLGKPVYSDIREGKRTLPIILALERLDETSRAKLLSTLGRRDASREELEYAARLIISSGALEECERMARYYAEKALQALRRLPSNEARKLLEELTIYVVERMR